MSPTFVQLYLIVDVKGSHTEHTRSVSLQRTTCRGEGRGRGEREDYLRCAVSGNEKNIRALARIDILDGLYK